MPGSAPWATPSTLLTQTTSSTTLWTKALRILTHLRRRLWGLVVSSLSIEHRARTEGVPRGDLEALVRKVRSLFFRKSANTRDALKERLFAARLEDHSDIEAYMGYQQDLVRTLHQLGYSMDEEDRQYYLLRGLPADYQPVVQAVKLPQPDGNLLAIDKVEGRLATWRKFSPLSNALKMSAPSPSSAIAREILL